MRAHLASEDPIELDKHRGMAAQKAPISAAWSPRSRQMRSCCAIAKAPLSADSRRTDHFMVYEAVAKAR
jgi:hypothetical protein